jgi:protein-S-isoprenylcysteine O-methyltransferase Ste14
MSKRFGVVIGAVMGAVVGALVVQFASPETTLPALRRLVPTVAIWVAFFAYWAAAARTAKPTQEVESGGSTVFHQTLLASALLLLFAPIPGLTGRFVPRSTAVWLAGIVLQAASAALGIWARRHLGRNWAAEVRIAVDHQLVRSGPYRVVRHPIYTAMLGMFLGTAVSSGQLHALVGVALLMLAYVRKTRLEEQILREHFGPVYDDYRRDSWALVPWLY